VIDSVLFVGPCEPELRPPHRKLKQRTTTATTIHTTGRMVLTLPGSLSEENLDHSGKQCAGELRVLLHNVWLSESSLSLPY
jgi:hypothetical protein